MHAFWAFQGLENLNLGRVDEVLEPGNPYFFSGGFRRGLDEESEPLNAYFFYRSRRRRPLDEEFQFGLAFKLPSKFGTHVDDPKGDFLFSDSKRLKNPKKMMGVENSENQKRPETQTRLARHG